MAVPVVFSLQKALSAGDGLQFVDRLASSLKIDSARVQLDGAQFDEQSEVAELTIFVRYDVDNPQAAQTILHTMGVEWRQLRDEKSGHLADGHFEQLLSNVAVSDYCLSAKMADARALVGSKHEANFEEEAHVSDEMLAKLSDPLGASETSPAQKSPKEAVKTHTSPAPAKTSASNTSEAPKTKAPAALAIPKKSRFSHHTRVATSFSDTGSNQSTGERPAVMRFVDFFEGLNLNAAA